MRRGDVIDLLIESLAFGGAGVGRYSDPKFEDRKPLAVFVDNTVPGDRVRARIGSIKRKYVIGHVEDFLEKSTDRISPDCSHFGSPKVVRSHQAEGELKKKFNTETDLFLRGCGGCSLQNLAYQKQLEIKEQHVRDTLTRIGGFQSATVMPIIGCESPWEYRNKMEFSFSRTKEGLLSLGLHVRRRHHDVIEIKECLLMSPYVGPLVMKVRDFMRESAQQHNGSMKPLSFIVREGKNTGEVMINLVYENGEPVFLDHFAKLVKDFFDQFSSQSSIQSVGKSGPGPTLHPNQPVPTLTSLFFTNITNRKGSPKKTEERLLHGRPVIRETLRLETGSKLIFEISPQSFFQPNTRQAEVLYHQVLLAAGLTGTETVFDLYCGAGTIGSFCAHAAGEVYGIEMNQFAVENAQANARLNGIKNIKFFVGDVGKTLDQMEERLSTTPDVIIIDPPRGGLDLKALELVTKLKANRIVYVSCNPATLARDLQLIAKTGWTLARVQPVDMFPQTYHIESVAVLERFPPTICDE